MLFGQQLTDDACAARAHGGANGEFTLAAGGADKQKIGDIGAGDEQNEADGAQKDEKGITSTGDDGVAQSLDAEAAFCVHVFRMKAAILIGDEFQLGVGLGEGDARLEAAGDKEIVAEVGAVGIDLEGDPDVGLRIGDERFSQDTDDGVGLVAEGDAGTGDVGVAAELALPEAVADDHDVAAVGSLFLGGEGAAEDDGRAEEAEVGFGNVDAVDLLGNDAGEVEARATEIVGGDVLKDAGLGFPDVVVNRRAAGAVALRKGVHELHDALGLGIGERFQEDGVDDGEDSGVGSDAEGDSGDGGQGEGRARNEHAERVAEVLPEITHVGATFWFGGFGSYRVSIRLGRVIGSLPRVRRCLRTGCQSIDSDTGNSMCAAFKYFGRGYWELPILACYAQIARVLSLIHNRSCLDNESLF